MVEIARAWAQRNIEAIEQVITAFDKEHGSSGQKIQVVNIVII